VLVRPTVLAAKVIGLAIRVHRNLGPGLLESAYEACLAQEFTLGGIEFGRQMPVPVLYRGLAIDCAYRADMIVDGTLLLEIKSVNEFSSIHQAQVLTYLKLLGLRQGMLMNFNRNRLVDGIRNVLV